MISALSLAAVLSLTVPTHAQTQPAFEAASIKSSQGDMDQFRVSAGGIDVRDFSLRSLIQTAYDVQSFQISGGPVWLASDRFNIVARSTGAPSRQQTNLMLQTLLAERFHLGLHRESKELPVYHLVLAKNGPKLTAAPADARPGDGDFHWGLGRVQGQSVTIEELCEMLSSQLQHQVVDKTNLAGRFDLKLLYTPDNYRPRDSQAPVNPNEPRPDPEGASIFSALQEQLGLKLDPAKGRVEVLVIDRAEKPSEN